MLPLNHVINSATITLSQNIITTSPVDHQLLTNKQKQQQQKQKPLRSRITTTTISTIASTSLFSVNTTNITSSSSFPTSTSSTQQQQISFEDSYSAKTGIKTAALLGGM
jgi:hypothetical protein